MNSKEVISWLDDMEITPLLCEYYLKSEKRFLNTHSIEELRENSDELIEQQYGFLRNSVKQNFEDLNDSNQSQYDIIDDYVRSKTEGLIIK